MSTHYLVCDQCAELYNKPALEITMWGWRHTMPLYGIKCAM